MNRQFVLALSCLGFSLGVPACGANNGKLFDGVALPVSGDPADGSTPPGDTAAGDAPTDTPLSNEPMTGEDDPGDGELGGEVIVPVRPGPPPPPPREPDGASEPEPDPEPAAPSIVSVSPSDGAVGVGSDTNIVIRFSEPMDRAATEAAYQSESAPSGAVSFEWSEDSTELSVLPEAPLAYSSGPSPDAVEARRISYFISASAAASDGRSLERPYEFSFSLLRQIELGVFAIQDRALSGNFRSNDTYGAGDCAQAEINMCVGDVRVSGRSEQYKGFVSFELGELPAELSELRATLSLQITGMAGNPFTGLGDLILEHTRFDEIDLDAFDAEALEELGPIAEQGTAGTLVSADVSAAVLADLAAGNLTQYRLRFADETDSDLASDAIVSSWETQALQVTYLIP